MNMEDYNKTIDIFAKEINKELTGMYMSGSFKPESKSYEGLVAAGTLLFSKTRKEVSRDIDYLLQTKYKF